MILTDDKVGPGTVDEFECGGAAGDTDSTGPPWQSPREEVEGWTAAVALCFGFQGQRWLDYERL